MVKSPEETEIFVKKNLGLVHSCANRFRARHIEYDDLFAAGSLGLLKAIKGFDESRGLQFSTYAVPVILGEIKRLFRDGGAIKVSRSLKELSVKVLREKEKLAKLNFREPTIKEIATSLDVSDEQVVEALNASMPPMSLTMNDDDGDNQFDIPVDVIDEHISDRISLNTAINALDEKDKRIVILRYFNNKTQTQVAKILDMTQVQVSRREKKLLEKLRYKLAT
ncbi:MAG: sigma-70 family RNA polymerase sigma factor [Oscillospiraceae bacterium]